MRHMLSGTVITIAMAIASQAMAASGQDIYSQNCAVCHNNLDPKISDKAAWAPRLKQGEDALVAAAINGKGAMPARAGKPDLSDGDIRAAVQYMESKVK